MPRQHITNTYDVVARMYQGQSYVYHTGYLARDREVDTLANAVAADLLKYAQAGLVRLTQRKIRPDYYQYIVTRTGMKMKGALA